MINTELTKETLMKAQTAKLVKAPAKPAEKPVGGKVVGKPEKHFMSKAEYENS